jgi:hypothetical protein
MEVCRKNRLGGCVRALSRTSKLTPPNRISSSARMRTGPSTRRPFTNVPLVGPRSRISKTPDRPITWACCGETVGSSMTSSLLRSLRRLSAPTGVGLHPCSRRHRLESALHLSLRSLGNVTADKSAILRSNQTFSGYDSNPSCDRRQPPPGDQNLGIYPNTLYKTLAKYGVEADGADPQPDRSKGFP